MSVRHVTIDKFTEETGYSADAVRSKIKRGDWLEGVVWRKAPDSRILIDLEGYEWWVVNGTTASAALRIRQSRSISTTTAFGAAND